MTSLQLIIASKNYSSWSLRPWLVLKMAKLSFEEICIPLYEPNTRQRILEYSTSGKLPLLIADGFKIWDSLAICEYLAERFPEKALWPRDGRARALARSICAEMHSSFTALRKQLPMDISAPHIHRPVDAEAQKDIQRILDIWQQCRTQYGSNGDYLFGGLSIADAFYAPVVLRFNTYQVPLPDFAQHYAEKIMAWPALQEWLQDAVKRPENTDPKYQI